MPMKVDFGPKLSVKETQKYHKSVLNILCVTQFVTSSVTAWRCDIAKMGLNYKKFNRKPENKKKWRMV